MRLKLNLSVLAIALAVAACADGERDPAVRAAEWAVASADPIGPPVSCIALDRVASTAARDDRTLDISTHDGATLRNRLPFACPGIAREGRILYRTSTDRLCSTDLVTVVRGDGSAGPTCGLGMFQAIRTQPLPPATR